ncbi:MAG: hypothetical protein HQ575_07760, partial [Candidatus Omnitrophica bacterium]|nr:hypothetical protein [Candidatus Omnitrophota bacterium]
FLGGLFRIGYVLPLINPYWSFITPAWAFVIAVSSHALYNNILAPWFGWVVGMAGARKHASTLEGFLECFDDERGFEFRGSYYDRPSEMDNRDKTIWPHLKEALKEIIKRILRGERGELAPILETALIATIKMIERDEGAAADEAAGKALRAFKSELLQTLEDVKKIAGEGKETEAAERGDTSTSKHDDVFITSLERYLQDKANKEIIISATKIMNVLNARYGWETFLDKSEEEIKGKLTAKSDADILIGLRMTLTQYAAQAYRMRVVRWDRNPDLTRKIEGFLRQALAKHEGEDQQTAGPAAVIGWLWKPLIKDQWISKENAAIFSWVIEELLYLGIALYIIPWALSPWFALGPVGITLSCIGLNLVSGFAHNRIYRWSKERIDGRTKYKIIDKGPARLRHKLLFTGLETIFRAGYLLPLFGFVPGMHSIAWLIIASTAHLIYNAAIAPKLRLPVGMAAPSYGHRERLLAAEPVDKEIYEKLFEINLKLIALCSKRMKYKEKDEREYEEVLGEIESLVNEALGVLPKFREKPYTRGDRLGALASYRLDAEAFLNRALELVREGNEPAANACIVGALDRIASGRDALLMVRLGRRETLDRVRVNEKGSIILLQQRYVGKEWADTRIAEYVKSIFRYLWEAFRSMDEQIDGELNDRDFCIIALRLIDGVIGRRDPETRGIIEGGILDDAKRRMTSEDRAQRGQPRLTHDEIKAIEENINKVLKGLGGAIVEKKVLAKFALQSALELIKAGDIRNVEEMLNIARRHLGARREDTESIIESLQKGHLEILRRMVWERNDDIAGRAKNILDTIVNILNGKEENVDLETAKGCAEGLRRLKTMREPEFEGLKGLISQVIREIDSLISLEGQKGKDAEIEKSKDTIKRNLGLVMQRVKDAKILCRFMAVYRNTYVQKRLNGIYGTTREGVFNEIFQVFVGKKDLIRGSPTISWTRFYQPAFIPFMIKNPERGKKPKRIPNPTFKAVTKLAQIKETAHLERIIESKKITKTANPNTYALLKRLEEAGKRDITQFKKDDIIDLFAALALDYNLKGENRLLLENAFYGIDIPLLVIAVQPGQIVDEGLIQEGYQHLNVKTVTLEAT